MISFADFSAGVTVLLDARNSKTHGTVTLLLDKLAVSIVIFRDSI